MKTRALQRSLLVIFLLAGGMGWAQQRGGGRERGARPGRPPRENTADMQMRQFDKNGDLYIAEPEFRDTFDQSVSSIRDAYAKLVKLFDGDGDEQLNAKETQEARAFVWTLNSAQRFDTNRDFTLSAEEEDEAWKRLMEAARLYNQAMVDRFDTDGDGKLSAEESAAAKKVLENRRGAADR